MDILGVLGVTEQETLVSKAAIVGVGCAGVNTVSRLVDRRICGYEMITVSEDVMHLMVSRASQKILLKFDKLGSTQGKLDMDSARVAASERCEDIRQSLAGSKVVFTVCGLGGPIGGGATPVVLAIARSLGAFTVAFCIWPFSKQGEDMQKNAETALTTIRDIADSTVVVQNDCLLNVRPALSINAAFRMVDDFAISVFDYTVRQCSPLWLGASRIS